MFEFGAAQEYVTLVDLKMLQNELLLVKISFDTADDGLPKDSY